ncbi:hypothetical protein EYR40_002271 [Pleurotus pulmonarius]|nr:hypothetical protein EYR36_002237 [Pleurotus pulmonarius]KAF4583780.1 hypothetical protein EYR40_002271 [Pleurotus pulmonarius]
MHLPIKSDLPLSFGDAFNICGNTKSTTVRSKITRFIPLRCMRCRGDSDVYEVVPFHGGEYVAISYSWPGKDWVRLHDSNFGTQIARESGADLVECNHFSSFTRKAFEDAVKATKIDQVWLDYMCIDQTNNAEKEVQVALMDRFYSNASLTVILLEDVELSNAELDLLQGSLTVLRNRSGQYVEIVWRILNARWFGRAWCSQEWVLSRSPVIYVHRTDDPYGRPMAFSWASLKHWINRAGIYDPQINDVGLTDPRGSNTWGTNAQYNFQQSIAWAFGIVNDLGCFNQYDKIALVNNLVHADMSSRIVDLPAVPPPNTDPRLIAENVVKIVNVLAILREDFSLLLTSHVANNPLRGSKGFSWAGPSIRGDAVAQAWSPRTYEVHGSAASLAVDGLRLKGIAMEICDQTDYEFVRNAQGLHAKIDGVVQNLITSEWLSAEYPTASVPSNWLSAESPGTRLLHANQAFFRDLCYIVDNFNLVNVYQLIFNHAHDQWWYDPRDGDLKTQMGSHFTHYSLTIMFYASMISFLWEGKVGRFSVVRMANGLELLVRGNVSDLRGKLLFQPYVIRPKELGPHHPTVNSFVLEKLPQEQKESKLRHYKCYGAVRGFGLLPAEGEEIHAHVD